MKGAVFLSITQIQIHFMDEHSLIVYFIIHTKNTIIPIIITLIAIILRRVRCSRKKINARYGTKRYDNDSMILTSFTCTPWLIAKILTAIEPNIIA